MSFGGMNFVKKGRTLICTLDGEFDLTGAEAFKAQVESWFARYETVRNLVIDMRAVDFVDSSGLGAILGRYRKLASIGGKVAVVGLSPSVRRVFELSGVLGYIVEARTLNEALAAV